MIIYETGNPHFEGRTVIELAGNGRVFVRQTLGDQTREYAKVLDPAVYGEVLDRLREACGNAPGWPGNPPVPGETLVKMRATAPGEAIGLSVWSNQRWGRPALDRLISDFERLAAEASEGAVRF